MKSFPLKSLKIQEATELQFKLVDEITKVFKGNDSLSLGDLGVNKTNNQPIFTTKVEEILRNFFHVEDCILVTGSGTGAIRWSLISELKVGDNILVHDAPIYPTTKVSLETLGIKINKINFNNIADINKIKPNSFKAALVQYSRQKPDDSYDFAKVVQSLTKKGIKVITDDNYAAMKTGNIGTDFGAILSSFSAFKLLGPEGIGIVLGQKSNIELIKKMNYSGGSKVQGYQALEVLRGLVYSPVSLAIQADQINIIKKDLLKMKIKEIDWIETYNAQSKVIIIKFNNPIAKKVLQFAESLGALPNPIGAESKYEIVPLFYKVSSTFNEYFDAAEDFLIRINPNRSSAKTVIKILLKSIKAVT